MTWVSRREAASWLGVNYRTIGKQAYAGALHSRIRDGAVKLREYWIDDEIDVDDWSDVDEAPPACVPCIPDVTPSKNPPLNDDSVHQICWISDVHVPDHDVHGLAAWMQWITDAQPDEIMLGGDIAEMGSCSQHGGDANPQSLMDDIASLKAFLRAVRKACPSSTLTFLEGNHETRLSRVVVSNLPTFNGAIDIPTLCDFDDLNIDWIPYGKLVQRGKLRFVHGAYANDHHAANHLRRFGCSIVYGHTHRPQIYTRATADMEMQAAYGMPCMRTLAPEWMGGGPSGWGHGFGVIYTLPDGSFTVYPVFVTRGRFVWNGKIYDGARQ